VLDLPAIHRLTSLVAFQSVKACLRGGYILMDFNGF
jgi:hypothetical protein